MIVGGLGLALLWWRDLHAPHGKGHPHPLPGATGCSSRLIWVGIAAGLALVAAETIGESHLGISHEQATLAPLFAVWTLVAAVVEEIVFRGYLVIQGRGKLVLWCSVVGFSTVFAALHPFLWSWESAGFQWTPGLKGWFSTAFAFGGSLAFYGLRFNRWNPTSSLLPSFAAHLAKNAAVIVIKASLGFVG